MSNHFRGMNGLSLPDFSKCLCLCLEKREERCLVFLYEKLPAIITFNTGCLVNTSSRDGRRCMKLESRASGLRYGSLDCIHEDRGFLLSRFFLNMFEDFLATIIH